MDFQECDKCGGVGRVHVMRTITRTRPDGTQQSYETSVGMEPCDCLRNARNRWAVGKAGIPPTLSRSTFANFRPVGDSQAVAHQNLAHFVSHWLTDFPENNPQRSIMLVGPCGVGKSHLSAAALTEMITIYGINGMWLNMRSYLDDLKNVFARGVPNDITERVIDAEILVLDDLGSARKTDFSEEMTAQIIEARHQRHMSTIFSTNLAFKEPARVSGETEGIDKFKLKSTDTRETLGDRVGYRTFSRLSEMCRVFTIEAPDYRQTRGGA